MSYTTVDSDEVEPVGGGLHFLREPLECENLGVSVLECDPGWEGKPHDHAGDGQEEVYVLVDGEATVTVDGDPITPSEYVLQQGDEIRIVAERSDG